MIKIYTSWCWKTAVRQNRLNHFCFARSAFCTGSSFGFRCKGGFCFIICIDIHCMQNTLRSKHRKKRVWYVHKKYPLFDPGMGNYILLGWPETTTREFPENYSVLKILLNMYQHLQISKIINDWDMIFWNLTGVLKMLRRGLNGIQTGSPSTSYFSMQTSKSKWK